MNTDIKKFPAIFLKGVCLLPEALVQIDTNSERAFHAAEYAERAGLPVCVFTQVDPTQEGDDPDASDLYKVGVVADVVSIMQLKHGFYRISLKAVYRGKRVFLDRQKEFDSISIRPAEIDEDDMDDDVKEAMREGMMDAIHQYESLIGKKIEDVKLRIWRFSKTQHYIYYAVSELPLTFEKKQEVLNAESLQELYEVSTALILKAISIFQIKQEIEGKVREKLDKNQREYVLREQMKVIREELGEDTTSSDIDRFFEEAEKLEASDEIKEKIKKEINRFKNLGSNSADSAVSRGYIETLLEMPWDKSSRDNMNLKNAKKILDRDHYGLEKVKDRILEYLAVRSLTKKGDAPIICLVGPPGTGKTSIARSVAEALEKKYIRISLGGVRDEAEIRGHRRTYVGALPGRIAQGLRSAGVKNPLMLLDEIDKVSEDYKGDTFSALLEVLDPDQNSKFADHYIELPIDLSDVLFIATANTTQTIPAPLLDRMEVIEISSYTENEKLHIASEHLLKKQIEKNGLTKDQLKIPKKMLERVIRDYTREAGVRNLERRIGEICMKAAKEIVEGETEQVRLSASNIEHYLGKAKYSYKKANSKDAVGIVRGLAWTSVGGVTLQVEVNVMPGKGSFQLTGQMGDVMKESAQTAVSYARSVSENYHISRDFYQTNDIHIHIPEGATPKDGPSAGITMATAILSAITKIPVRADVAMTGEITLRGRVLPIGGLKEKLLAAKVAGMKTVLVPKENKGDVEELSEEITDGLRIIFVEQMDEVLAEALAEKEKKE